MPYLAALAAFASSLLAVSSLFLGGRGKVADSGRPPADGDGSGGGGPDGGTGDGLSLAESRCVEESLPNPPELEADEHGGYTLRLAAPEVRIAGQRDRVWAYDVLFSGPTATPPRARAPPADRCASTSTTIGRTTTIAS